jgi:ketosteroid isomerase-like protein
VSAENVEIVRRMLEDYLRGDNEAALAAYDPDVEFDATVRPDGQIFHGPAGVAEAMRTWTGAFEDWKMEVQEIVDAGDKVMVGDRQTGRGKGSGIEIDDRTFSVYTLRGGKIVHLRFFFDRDQALEAAGLRGSTVPGDHRSRARQAFAAVAQRDIDTLLELTDPEVEWRSFFAMLGEGGEYHGHDGMRQYVSDLTEAWETLRPEIDDLVGVGDVVLGVGSIHYRGKGSGVESGSRAGWLFKFRDGRILRFHAFRDPEAALEQVGWE